MAEPADELVEPSKQKTCVLKASIHCEGCKRKVKKILSQIHGVEFVDVDTKQQKVTVIGNVQADTLITKLTKSGKHAQLWPAEKSDKTQKNNSKMKEKSTAERPGKVVDHQEPPNNPASVSQPTSEQNPSVKNALATKNGDGSSSAANNDDKIGGACVDASAKSKEISGSEESGKVIEDAPVKTSVGVLEPKTAEKAAEDCSTGGKSPEKSNEGGEVGASGKKKKKKGQNRNVTASEHINSNEPVPEVTANQGPPRQQYYQPHSNHHYYSPPVPPPVYGVSYNTAHPNSSYTASYYAAPPPYSYAYAYPGSENEPPPIHESRPSQTLDSFEMFSDENPNGCTVA